MQDFAVAIGLVLVIEGVLWALFPAGMREAASRLGELPPGLLRYGGLGIAAIGLVIVWLVRG